jgi:flagellar hook-basal body complex protein FliE
MEERKYLRAAIVSSLNSSLYS